MSNYTGTADSSGAGPRRHAPADELVANEIRRRREAAGLSQKELAKRVGFSREYVSRAERPSSGLPSENLVAILDAALDAGGGLLQLHAAASGVRRERRHDLACAGRSAESAAVIEVVTGDDVVGAEAGLMAGGSEIMPVGSAADVMTPDILLLGVLDLVDVLDVVDACTESVVERYEVEGPALLVSEVLDLRRVCRTVAPRVGRSQRTRVARAGARLAAIMAYMSVNLDRYANAESFAFEASMLATAAKERELLAWVKGTQSLAAYYQGRYRDALRYAQAGLQLAGSGAQRVRLLSNGTARAAGKLGEHRLVERAVDEALTLAADRGPTTGLTPCITFDAYGQARALANAATAYLSVGRYQQVLELTGQLDGVVAESDSDWSRALVRLDTASALARGAGGDLAHALIAGHQALEQSRTNPIASIGTRAAELATVLAEAGAAHARVEEFRAAIRDWRSATEFGGPKT